MRSICVFCGSSPGNDSAYAAGVVWLGRTLAHRADHAQVGEPSVPDLTLQERLRDHPHRFATGSEDRVGDHAREPDAPAAVDLRYAVLRERKALMPELSDGFIALPGGNGSPEEFFEVQTWAQLGEHAKPCKVLNTGGYYDPLLALFDLMVARAFLS